MFSCAASSTCSRSTTWTDWATLEMDLSLRPVTRIWSSTVAPCLSVGVASWAKAVPARIDEPKADEFGHAACRNQDVRRLQVAVCEPLVVNPRHYCRDPSEEAQSLTQGQFRRSLQQIQPLLRDSAKYLSSIGTRTISFNQSIGGKLVH